MLDAEGNFEQDNELQYKMLEKISGFAREEPKDPFTLYKDAAFC